MAERRFFVRGEVDLANAPTLHEEMRQVLNDNHDDLVVDCCGLTFIDSSGLRMLIGLNDRAEREGWTLALLRPAEPSLSVFQITGADDNLPFIEEPENVIGKQIE